MLFCPAERPYVFFLLPVLCTETYIRNRGRTLESVKYQEVILTAAGGQGRGADSCILVQ